MTSSMSTTHIETYPGLATLVACAGLQPTDSALILVNLGTVDIGEALAGLCRPYVAQVQVFQIPDLKMHGQEPPSEVAAIMGKSSVIFGLTHMSLAHTLARQAAGKLGARYLSLPNYSWDTLRRPALQVDFNAIAPLANQLAEILTQSHTIQVTSALGTNLLLKTDGRSGNAAPGTCFEPGGLASPPDSEVNIPPLETESEGIIVVDGSIPCPQIGLVESPITLTIKRGRISAIRGGYQADILESIFNESGWADSKMLAEFGLGLNPLAVLTGQSMLEDEGVYGTAHFGFGANSALGGQLSLPFHLDHVVSKVSVLVDGGHIMRDGILEVESWTR